MIVGPLADRARPNRALQAKRFVELRVVELTEEESRAQKLEEQRRSVRARAETIVAEKRM